MVKAIKKRSMPSSLVNRFSALVIALFFCNVIAVTESARVLALFPIALKSHLNTFTPIVEALASCGHEITFVSPYPIPSALAKSPNVTSYVLDDLGAYIDGVAPAINKESAKGVFGFFLMFAWFLRDSCHIAWNNVHMKEFLCNSGKYDVILANAICNHCFLPLAAKFEAPIVLVTPNTLWNDMSWKMDVPFPLAHIPMFLLPYHSPMTFVQRLINVVTAHAFQLFDHFIYQRQTHLVMLQHMPDAATSGDVASNAALVLTNSHFSLQEARPSMPYVIEVGGMHCRPGQKVSEEFETFISGSGDDGFIVFSMGSLMEGKSLPADTIDKFRKVFSRIKPRVIWKFEEKLNGLSNNTMISPWIPQHDLIAHPKCRLAITHGGLLSLQEVVYHGVPLLGFPKGIDRENNIHMAKSKGFAESLDIDEATEDQLVNTINRMLQDQSYSIKAKEISSLTRDRPQTPKESAIYWIEYVIRHKGAPHLKSSARHLNLIQYLLLDVYSTLALVLLLCILIPVLFLKFVWRRFCRGRNPQKQKTN